MATQESRDHLGERWGVSTRYTSFTETKGDDGRTWYSTQGQEPDCYCVIDVYGDEPDGGEFSTLAAAQKAADRRNRKEVEATLDPAFAGRRKALRRLGETFWVRYGDGPHLKRWPERPERYAVEEFSERYSESFWNTYDAAEEIEQAVRSGDVNRIVDLDTGQDIPFRIDVAVEFG